MDETARASLTASSALDRALDGFKPKVLAPLGAIVRTRVAVARIVGRPVGDIDVGQVRSLWRSSALYEGASGQLFVGVGLPSEGRPLDRSKDEAFRALAAHRCSALPESAFTDEFGEHVAVFRFKSGEPLHDGTAPSPERGTEHAHPGLFLSLGYRFDYGAGPLAGDGTIPEGAAGVLWHANVGFLLAPRLFVVGVHRCFEGNLVTEEAFEAFRAEAASELPLAMATVPERFAAMAADMAPHLHVGSFRGRMPASLKAALG